MGALSGSQRAELKSLCAVLNDVDAEWLRLPLFALPEAFLVFS